MLTRSGPIVPPPPADRMAGLAEQSRRGGRRTRPASHWVSTARASATNRPSSPRRTSARAIGCSPPPLGEGGDQTSRSVATAGRACLTPAVSHGGGRVSASRAPLARSFARAALAPERKTSNRRPRAASVRSWRPRRQAPSPRCGAPAFTLHLRSTIQMAAQGGCNRSMALRLVRGAASSTVRSSRAAAQAHDQRIDGVPPTCVLSRDAVSRAPPA